MRWNAAGMPPRHATPGCSDVPPLPPPHTHGYSLMGPAHGMAPGGALPPPSQS